ncbi:uncharacterized protein DFL_008851 [Arthrobotrys flagrans]|uniref:GTP-binding protein 8 n=1 Tax=Arthrobotrys flagrans TaxID=97331 RepID=A0A436ZPY8_ARTFL|nr:hypothetical protein DFL_008851 [Arthrobotrys flagrans]
MRVSPESKYLDHIESVGGCPEDELNAVLNNLVDEGLLHKPKPKKSKKPKPPAETPPLHSSLEPPKPINQKFKASKFDIEEGFEFKPPEPTISSTAYRWDVETPNTEQLKYAARFFEKYPVRFLWGAEEFASIPDGAVPEVAFLGRSNVGKSSILNALMAQKGMARTSSKPGRTKQMNAFSVGGARLTLLDMPGYGHGSRESWGREIMEYLRSRKQFRRAFLLIDPVHGFKEVDMMIMEAFADMGIPYQLVLSKTDKLDEPKKKRERLATPHINEVFMDVQGVMRDHGGHSGFGEILATSSEPVKKGINELRWAILRATGLEPKKKK